MDVPDSKEDRAEEFVHIVSHDLKEPLRSMRNFSYILLEDYADTLDPDAQEYLHIISRCAQRLQHQIDSLARYACTGQCSFSPAIVSLPLLVQDTKENLNLLIGERHADVRYVSGPVMDLYGDRACLVEILTNLVQNAIKYNENAAPIIEVGLQSESNEERVVYVRDNGIGIHKDHHDVIFKIFRRLHPVDSYGGGTGNGLASVRRLVSQAGGRVWVESDEGLGATFFFTMPLGKAPTVESVS